MGIISYGKNIQNEINLKVNFCYKEKLMKGNNICYMRMIGKIMLL